MPTVYTEVEVDVELDDFDDEDLIDELQRRGRGFEVDSKTPTELVGRIHQILKAAKIVRRDIHTRYIQYIQIHTHMHKHTYIIHTHMHSNTCKYIQFAIVISQFWVNAYVYVSYVSCMYLVCISVDIFQSICACIVCIVCMRMYAVCMVCIGRGKH